ncbi:hypothetical protein HEK616_40320 [Streptomyces nigrescens]|uniref:Uncharacterized protein n=1 Tax=Streptomyces nigrescens TaxID=1920 RepID=A0ABM7ZW31_STRNI|nr:hypothetical protein [Streptomyces nigrescens]BDM70545.1 hypothetical protein HEK616_40320 [Streptomyces nigrescens]
MKITAERVTAHTFVVAVDEMEALEKYAAGNTFDRERDAMEHEGYRNGYDRHHTGDALNTYKIVVHAEKVH